MHSAAGEKCDREDGLGSHAQPCSSSHQGPSDSSLGLSETREAGTVPLPHPPHCQSQALWKFPRVVQVQGEGEGPSLGLLQLPNTKPL